MDDDCWCAGGSIGPATDGRIKPDLCAFYDDILTTSTGGSTSYTETFGGTSGATPIIAGHVGLFFDMWADGIFGNDVLPPGSGPTGYDVFDNRAHMTTAKAMLINNATQYPFTGTSHDKTRVHQGWGWPNVQRIYDMREKIYVINETEVLGNLETITFPLSVEPGEPEFRATLVYADPPGTVGSTYHRINDLTLLVVSPSGNYYWGNHGLLEGNFSIPNAGGPNTVDTVENVLVENPEDGLWIVQVMADEIVEDGHIETEGVLDADFALVVSGVIPCSSRGGVRLDRSVYPCSATASLRVVDCDLNTDDEVAETIVIPVTSTSEPTGEMVTLTETGPATAAFNGSIALSTTDAEGVLWVADADLIVATYIDEDDGMGGVNIEVTDDATVDCAAPLIENVTASDITPRAANVSFDANESVRATVYYGLSCGALDETAASSAYSTSPVVVVTGLDDDTTYYYAVEAEDIAGNSVYDDNGGACYSFTTPEVPDFFTEMLSPNDLHYTAFKFVPAGGIDFYVGCIEEMEITELPSDPAGGTAITLSDDSAVEVSITGTVSLYGVDYNSFYVCSNGFITFGASETTYTESLEGHFGIPRVAALWDDLNPSSGGTVSYREFDDRVAVTWLDVAEYSAGGANTFQIELFFDGTIGISYLGMTVTDGLAGLSAGMGLDPDFYPTDLSEMNSCGPRPPRASSTTVIVPVDTATTIDLVASDDGLPDPPAALTYTVTSLPDHGTLADVGAGAIGSVPYTLVDGGNQVVYTPAGGYYGEDGFNFLADDSGVAPEGGQSNEALLTVQVQYDAPNIITEQLPAGCLNIEYGPVQLQADQGQPELTWMVVNEGEYTELDLGSSLFSGIGTAQGWHADDSTWPYTLPFSFPFYGVDETEVIVSSNGWLNFGDWTGSSYSNSEAILIENRRIAVLWDDLKTTDPYDIYIFNGLGSVIIRWEAITYSGSNPVNTSVTLFPDGRMQFHYGDGNTPLTNTIGISAGDGENYLIASYSGVETLTDANSLEFAPVSPMPAGMVFNPDGSLGGTPTEFGTFMPRFRVMDSLGRLDEQQLTLVINEQCDFPVGDMDCSGELNAFDIDPFVLALVDPAGYAAQYPGCDINLADVNDDGQVNVFDIDGFVALLQGN